MKKLLMLLALTLLPSFAYAQQNTLTQTTLSQAQTDSATVLQLASLTNVTFGVNSSQHTIIIIDGEEENVLNIIGNAIIVSRGQEGTKAFAHASGTIAVLGRPSWFYKFSPAGYVSVGCANVFATPWYDVQHNLQWICSTVTSTWVPGFGNYSVPQAVSAPVASAAGAVLPSGPLFHITGTAAITGFTDPVGCNATAVGGCEFTVIPDAAFTWTTAGNIATAGTAVANLAIIFTWDATTSKWIVNQSK